MAKKIKPLDIFPGSIPDEDIYHTLGIEIDPGEVKFSSAAQKHAYRRHGSDLQIIIPHLSEIISDPMYMGDDFRNPGKIEFVRRIPGEEKPALVALTVEKGDDGYYHVCSSYLISQSDADKKRDKGVLKNVKKKRR